MFEAIDIFIQKDIKERQKHLNLSASKNGKIAGIISSQKHKNKNLLGKVNSPGESAVC